MSAATTIMGLAASAARNVRPQVNALMLMAFAQLIQLIVHMEHLLQQVVVEDVTVVNQVGTWIHQHFFLICNI